MIRRRSGTFRRQSLQQAERKRLFEVLEQLVPWEANNDQRCCQLRGRRSSGLAMDVCPRFSTLSEAAARSLEALRLDCQPTLVT